MSTDVLGEFKQGIRAMWAAGDYGASGAVELWPVGERIVERVAIAPGERVLDVACGTGNAAIRAAQAGSTVTGLDLTPELFDGARANAAAAGVEVDWVTGDAEALPFEDDSFDVVLSTFGCMFAPRHEVAAGEIVRVLRPGGRIGITTWLAEGKIGQLFKQGAADLPPFAQPPHRWGEEAHVREIFAGTRLEPVFELGEVSDQLQFDSHEEAVEFFTAKFGPLVFARRAAEAAGTWPQMRAGLIEQFSDKRPAEYLVIMGSKE